MGIGGAGMAITLDSPIVGNGGPLTVEYDISGARRIDEIDAYVNELHRLCTLVGFDWRILFAQAWHETDGFRSHWWNTRLNPAGIGITGDPRQNDASHTWANGTEAARAHVAHMYAYATKPTDGSKSTVLTQALGGFPWQFDPRYSAVFDAGFAGTVRTLGDLGNGKWATDPRYAEKIVAKANQIFKDPQGETPMAIVATECQIILDPLTGPSVNRPALAMPDASFVTVHEVGNTSPGANAKMHRDFVHNGGGSNAVSFHFVVDEDVIYQLVYLNENAWHASDYYSGRGNRDSIAIETVQIGNFQKTLGNLAWLIAEIYRNPTRFLYRSDVGRADDLDPGLVKERTKRHYDWAPDKKWCPQFMLTRELWLPLLDAVTVELKDVAPVGPKYHPPILPEWWSEQAVIDLRSHREDNVLYKPLGSRVTALRDTGAYTHPWLPDGKGKRTRANIKKGETVDLRYVANHPRSGDQWGITRYGTWVALKYFTPRFTIRNIVED